MKDVEVEVVKVPSKGRGASERKAVPSIADLARKLGVPVPVRPPIEYRNFGESKRHPSPEQRNEP